MSRVMLLSSLYSCMLATLFIPGAPSRSTFLNLVGITLQLPLPLSTPSPLFPAAAPPPPPPPPRPTTTPSPGQFLNLASFKLQLPSIVSGVANEKIVKQPQLSTFSSPGYFFLRNSSSTSPQATVVLVAFAGGATTNNSEFPRTELAETVYSGLGGEVAARWSIPGNVIHNMTWSGATVRLTPVRPVVVIAQIKGVTDTPLQIRVQGVFGGQHIIEVALFNKVTFTLDANYVLGADYTIRLSAGQGKILVFYQDMINPAVTLDGTPETQELLASFKIGNYLQSNTANGELASSSSAVWIYGDLLVTQG